MSSRTARRPRPTGRPPRLTLQALEDRCVPAEPPPSPVVAFDGKDLVIFGTDRNDTLSLSADALGRILVRSGGKLLVPTDPNTGRPRPATLANTKSIEARLAGGNDQFDFRSERFPGGCPIRVLGELGDDRMTLRSPAGPQPGAGDPWEYDGGAGFDTFRLIATDRSEEITVTGKLVQGDIPCDMVVIRDRATKALMAQIMADNAEAMAVDAGRGDDAIAAAISWVSANVDVFLPYEGIFELGAGDDTFQFDFNSDVRVDLDLRVNAGAGDDLLGSQIGWASAFDAFIPIDAAFRLGSGNDALQAGFNSQAMYSDVRLAVDAGVGNDAVRAAITAAGAMNPCELAADAVIDLGAGKDTLEFENTSAAEEMRVRLDVDAGTGDDAVRAAITAAGAMNPCELAADAVIDLGAGHDALHFGGASAGDNTRLGLVVDGESGNDAVTMADGAFGGMAAVDFHLGTGDDRLTLDENAFALLILKADGGAGRDTVVASNNDVTGPAQVDLDLGAGNDGLTFEGNTLDPRLLINVAAGGGDDVVMTSWDVVKGPGLASIHLNLGVGNDQLAVSGIFEGAAALSIDTGAGKDNVTVDTPDCPDLLYVRCAEGKHLVELSLGSAGTGSGPHRVLVDGGGGDDAINVHVTVPQGNTATWNVEVHGGTGDDDLGLLITGDPKDLVNSSFLLDGDAGFDTCRASDIVRVIDCEQAGA